MKTKKLIYHILIFTLLSITKISAQQVIDINSPDIQKNILTRGQKSFRPDAALHDVDRYRTFTYNTKLRKLSPYNIGDTLLLNFFEDQKFKAVIKKSSIGYKNILGITAEIVDHPYSYCLLSISEQGITLSTEIIGYDKQFFIAKVGNESYVSEVKTSALQKYNICEGVLYPEDIKQQANVSHILNSSATYKSAVPEQGYECYAPIQYDIEAPVTIDIMIPYTAKAKQLADAAWEITDIDALVNQVILTANLVMENSKTGITFRLVHSYQTDFVEESQYAQNSDFQKLLILGDGYADDIQNLKIQYGADLVHVITGHLGGGLAIMSIDKFVNKEGLPSLGISTSGASAAAGSKYTVVHELAHNLGCGHSKFQTEYPGPGLYSYSAGWHGVIPGAPGNWVTRSSTVMTYESYVGQYPYWRIPYFSSPELDYYGTTIGDVQDANNALTLKQTKHFIARFSDQKIIFDLDAIRKEYGDSDPELTYTVVAGKLKEGDRIVVVRTEGERVARYYDICAGIFRGDTDVTCEYYPEIAYSSLYIKKKTIIVNDKTENHTGNPISILDLESLPSDIRPTVTYTGIDGTNYFSQLPPSEIGNYSVNVQFAGNTNCYAINETVTLKIIGLPTSVEDNHIQDKIIITPSIVKPNSTINIEANISNELLKNSEVLIYNLSGVCINKMKVQSQKISLKAPANKGIYIISFVSNDKSITESRIIVK